MLFFTALSVAKCHNRLPFAAKAETPQLFRSPLSSTPTATHFVPDLGEEMPMKPPLGAAHFSRSGVFSVRSAITKVVSARQISPLTARISADRFCLPRAPAGSFSSPIQLQGLARLRDTRRPAAWHSTLATSKRVS